MGDNLLASGMARGAAKRGKRVAFGDCRKIIWDKNSEPIFRGNPNIASPGSEKSGNLEWIAFYRGHRIYNQQGEGKWIWNYDFRPVPGELFFSRDEKKYADHAGRGFIVVEPNVPVFKTVAPNKQWPVDRYDAVALQMQRSGYDVVQFIYGPGHRLPNVRQIVTPTFRYGAALLKKASLYIGPEGGLHHAAAAIGIPGVVLFGGFVPPQVTGYPIHTNLTGGAEACGIFTPCAHCRAAMAAISVEEVTTAAMEHLTRVPAL